MNWRRPRPVKPILALVQASVVLQWAVFAVLGITEGDVALALLGSLGLLFGAAVLIAILLAE